MEDRATVRISSQHIANWLAHGIVSSAQVHARFQRMATVVDRQNAGDPRYQPMARHFSTNTAYLAALDLVFKGQAQPSGYSELLLHAARLAVKTAHWPWKEMEQCDVLVIGAGPAGSVAAQKLAAAGLDMVLVDQHDFPRDKVCGDGLIPDTHAALKRLGVYDEVAALATPVRYVPCVGPRGGYIDIPGSLSVLPRKTLDHGAAGRDADGAVFRRHRALGPAAPGAAAAAGAEKRLSASQS